MPPTRSTDGRAQRIAAGAKRTPEEARDNPAHPPFDDAIEPPRARSNAEDRQRRDNPTTLT